MTHAWWVCTGKIRSVLPDRESAWKLILCVHKELCRNDGLNNEAADFSVDTGTYMPKSWKAFKLHVYLYATCYFWLQSQKKYWLAFLLAEVEKITSKLIKKAVSELKAMICQSKS